MKPLTLHDQILFKFDSLHSCALMTVAYFTALPVSSIHDDCYSFSDLNSKLCFFPENMYEIRYKNVNNVAKKLSFTWSMSSTDISYPKESSKI